MADELIGATEVGRMLGVSRQRVHQLRAEHDDFPAPIVQHPRAAFWRERDITRWALRHGYPKNV